MSSMKKHAVTASQITYVPTLTMTAAKAVKDNIRASLCPS
jgi:hypothetical protein